MIIAIDIDDVLADTLNYFINYYNNLYKKNFSRKDFYIYHWWKILGLSKEEFLKIFYQFVAENNFKKFSPMRGAQSAINRIKKEHYLIVVTGRENNLVDATEYWLNRHFPNVFQEIYYTASMLEKKMEAISKTGACWQGGADLMIDDQFLFAKDCATSGLRTLLFDSPWNKNAVLPENMYRVKSWPEIIRKIKNIKY
jgi:uncharacterized HAD superfamily protein